MGFSWAEKWERAGGRRTVLSLIYSSVTRPNIPLVPETTGEASEGLLRSPRLFQNCMESPTNACDFFTMGDVCRGDQMQEISQVKTSRPSRDAVPAFVEEIADACILADVNRE